MAGGGLTVIRDNFVYLGAAPEATWGTDVVPTWFWKWQQGSSLSVPQTLTDEYLGDTDVWENFAYKQDQYADLKIHELVQPITVGYGLKSFCGTGSDTYTAPTYSTTLSSSVVAGATQVVLVADPTNVGTKVLVLEGGLAATNAEVITVDCTTRTGAGPWTVTLAAAGTVKLAHAGGVSVATAATHALTVQGTTYDPCAIEAGIGNATYGVPARVLRFRDACAYTWALDSGPGGKVATAQHDWYAGGQKVLAAWASPVYEQGNVPGSLMGSPMTHNQATGNWQLANLTTGNAATIRNFKLNAKRNTNAKAIISEAITPPYFLPGGMATVEGSFEVVFSSWKEYDLMVFGTSAAATNAIDSYIVGTEAFQTIYQADALNSLKIVMPNLRFKAAPPKLLGKGGELVQTVAFKALKLQGVTPLTVTLTNSYNQSY